jgi:GNAT superfamily N-acetyltransferase
MRSDLDEVTEYRRLKNTEHDIKLYTDCFAANGSARTPEWFKWQFLETPAGKLVIHLASPKGEPDRPAAIYAVVPVFFSISGRRILGCQSMDTLTAEAFRGKGLFVKLAARAYDMLPHEGISCIYGTPNGRSAHGIFARLGWVSLDPVPFMVKPLRARYIIERVATRLGPWLPNISLSLARRPQLTSNQNLARVTRFGDEYDDLWRTFSKSVRIGVWRDSQYLNWRLAKPGEAYRTWALHEDGRLLGFITFCIKSRDRGLHAHIMECIFDPARPDAGIKLIKQAIHEAAGAGVDIVMALNLPGSPNHGVFRRLGFLPVPPRYQPFEMHIGARAFVTELSADIDHRKGWYVSYLDSDTN